MRVNQRVSNPSLRGEVDHALDRLVRKEPPHPTPIGQIEFRKREGWEGFELRQPRLLQSNIVIIVKVIQSNDLVASFQ